MDVALRIAQLAAATGGEEEGKALLVALTRAGMLPALSSGREIAAKPIVATVDRIRLTERAETLWRCWNCYGRLGKGRDVAIWVIPHRGFLPFCCVSCRTTHQTNYPLDTCTEPCCS